jgi:hypothetical protein
MASYKKNNLRADHIQRFGQTTDLPLFNSVGADGVRPTIMQQTRFKTAPKSIPTGAETRKLAYALLNHDQLHLGEMCEKVWLAFAEFGPATNFEIAQRLGKESGWVSARNNDLRKLGLLTADIKRQCRVTGNVVQTWRVQ